MKYGYTKKKMEELEEAGVLCNYGQVLCLVCYQDNNEEVTPEMYCGSIMHTHLCRKHPDEFPETKGSVKHYRDLYPGAKIMGEGTVESIFEKNPNEKYKEVTINRLKKDVDEAGGLGTYSQNQLLLIHKKLILLADIYEKNEDYENMIKTLTSAEKVIDKIAPSKGTIPSGKHQKEASKEDDEALDKLDKLLAYMAKDVKGRKVTAKVEDGWTDSTG